METDLDLVGRGPAGYPPTQSLALRPSGHSSNAAQCPPGMEFLLNTSMILVHQLVEVFEAFTGFDTNNRYEILDAAGRRMYLAAEQSDCCVRFLLGSKRPFKIMVLDSRGGIVLKLERMCTCCFCFCQLLCSNQCNEMRVFSGTDDYLGKVTQNCCDCFCPSFTVWNQNDQKVLRIIGPCHICMCCSVRFRITDMQDNDIGEIHKKWGGFAKEVYTTADTFGVSFPFNLDPRLKTLMIGAVFLIDFMYFEQQPKDRNF